MKPQSNLTVNYPSMPELTARGMILGALITVIFTASNVYLGLKVGLTFSSSIPAAVISMAILRMFKHSNILENNMVQTQASAAGTFICNHLYPAGPAHARLLAGLPLLADLAALRLRRFSRRLVHHSPAPGYGRQQRPALSGRPGGC